MKLGWQEPTVRQAKFQLETGTGVDPWDRRGFLFFKAASVVIPTVTLNSLLKSGLFQPGTLLFSL